MTTGAVTPTRHARGGIGAVLLLPNDAPRVVGLLIRDGLGAQLLTSEPGSDQDPKQQRNTQAELLAILVFILTWGE